MNQPLAIASQFDKDVKHGVKPTDTKIFHIGATSRFARAHWFHYVSDMLETDPSYGISTVALGHSKDSHEKLEALAKYDNAYGLMARGAGTPQYEVIHAVTKNTFLPNNHEAVLQEMANPNIEIFSMTLTDPGYCRDKDSSEPRINRNDAQIIHDIAQLKDSQKTPEIKSGIGLVVAGLRERMRNNVGGVTIIPLDNLEGNGDITSALVLELAQEVDPTLANWIKTNATFPNTAVDRITPSLSPDFREAANDKFATEFPVIGSEVPRELAIDNTAFARPIPPLDQAGVIMTPDPTAFFTRKFGILNRGHTVVATLAQRIGSVDGKAVDTIDKAVAIPAVAGFFKNLLSKEVTSALPETAQTGIDGYIDEVISRLGNELLGDQVTRVGGEGHRKIPKYVFSGIERAQANDLPYEGLAVVAATWTLSAATGQDQNGDKIDLNDPNLENVVNAAIAMRNAALSSEDTAVALTNVQSVINENDFWKPFYDNGQFAELMAHYVRKIEDNDLRSVLSEYNDGHKLTAKITVQPT